MKHQMGCNAPWYELNISSADDCVAPCCYYSGKKDPWSDEFRTVEDYWNSPNMQTVRRINSQPDAEASGGCAGCYYFQRKSESAAYFAEFLTPSDGLSPAQASNWRAAIDDYQNGRQIVRSTPLRYYVNFGFACNLYCTMCHQVPRRKTEKRQVKSDILLKWKEGMTAALDVTLIGGEPFVLTEAIDFMKKFIQDPDFEPVQLTICTNGTMHDKHMDLLSRKRKLQLAVSLDTIGTEFEKIRIGAKWSQIEKNVIQFIETGKKLGYAWAVQTPCMLLKSNICKLVDFVDWTIEHGVAPGFYDFVNARGIEKTFEEENVIAHPQLVEQIPDWEDYFLEAVSHLRAGALAAPADQLDGLRVAIKENLQKRKSAAARADGLIQITNPKALFDKQGEALFDSLQKNIYGVAGAIEPVSVASGAMLFRPTHLNDHLATPYIAVPEGLAGSARWLRVRCTWPSDPATTACKLYVQDNNSHMLEPAESAAPHASRSQYDHVFEMPADAAQVRLVMTAAAMEPVLAPQAVTIERVA